MKPIHFAYAAVLLLLIAVVVCVWCSLRLQVPVLSSQFHDTAIADAKLTDAQLIKEYKAAGLSLKGVDQRELTDGDRSEAFYLPNERLAAAQSEILQRGSQIVPSLISFLEQEAPKEREKDPAILYNLTAHLPKDHLGGFFQIPFPHQTRGQMSRNN